MGYAYYTITRRGEEIEAGYDVVDVCNEPGCGTEINRGLGYLCGDTPGGDEFGCGGYYCCSHLYTAPEEQHGWRCVRCSDLTPPVVCLCGSTRFGDAFREQNLRLTLQGVIVLSIGCDTKSDHDLFAANQASEGAHLGSSVEEVKARLDWLHLRKIDLADRVLVLNVGGYIGESTRREIDYATELGKPIDYLEPLDQHSAPNRGTNPAAGRATVTPTTAGGAA